MFDFQASKYQLEIIFEKSNKLRDTVIYRKLINIMPKGHTIIEMLFIEMKVENKLRGMQDV